MSPEQEVQEELELAKRMKNSQHIWLSENSRWWAFAVSFGFVAQSSDSILGFTGRDREVRAVRFEFWELNARKLWAA